MNSIGVEQNRKNTRDMTRGGARNNSWGCQVSSCRVRHVNSNDINQSCFHLFSIAVNLIPFRQGRPEVGGVGGVTPPLFAEAVGNFMPCR